MNNNIIYIPTYISETSHTQFHKWKHDIVKFTILLKQDEFNGQVIDFSYAIKDLEFAGASYIDECLVWHFRRNNLLPMPSPLRDDSHLISSDFNCDDYLAIRDIYYPKNMKLPWNCDLINKSRKRKEN